MTEAYYIIRDGVPDWDNPVSKDRAECIALEEGTDIVSAREMAEAFPDVPPTDAEIEAMAAEFGELALLPELDK